MYALNTNRTTSPDNVENWTTYLLHLATLSIYMQKKFFSCFFFFFRFELPRLITNREQKKVGLWRIWQRCHTCPPLLGRWYRLLGTKWQHTWMCFCDFQISHFFFTNRMNNLAKKTYTKTHTPTSMCVIFIPFKLPGPMMLLQFGSPLSWKPCAGCTVHTS